MTGFTKERYIRESTHDKRMAWGDDYAGDAWRDSVTGQLRWVLVGHTPSEPNCDSPLCPVAGDGPCGHCE